MRLLSSLIATLPLVVLLSACSDSVEPEQAVVTQPVFHEFQDAHLKFGRSVWLGTCKNCHAFGFGGAPEVDDPEAWMPRIDQGKQVLYEHAINGFFGPDDAMMPARGGNDQLSDDEVRAAVDYMVALVQFNSQ
jgi:cytochrome c5